MLRRLAVLAFAILLLLIIASAQQLSIVVQRDNAPPVSVFSLSFLVPNRAFFVASGEWVYATYDSVAPGQFAAAAAITFGIGNFDSFIQRLVWFDAGTGRVDYDGHASTTVFLPCNATCLGRRRESNKEKKEREKEMATCAETRASVQTR